MSRHRFIRNININDELEVDALSDGGDDELDQAAYDSMMDGLERIREAIGPEQGSGISDREIKDTLYYYEFDVQQSIDWLLEEQARKQTALERKGKPFFSPIFSLSFAYALLNSCITSGARDARYLFSSRIEA